MVDYSQKGLKKCSKAWLSAQVHRISDSDLQPLLDCQLMLETTGTDWGGELEVSKCFAGALSTWWSSLLPWWRPRSLFIMPVWYTEDLCLRFKTGDLVGTLFFFLRFPFIFLPQLHLYFETIAEFLWNTDWNGLCRLGDCLVSASPSFLELFSVVAIDAEEGGDPWLEVY